MKDLPNDDIADLIRLIGRIIFKLKDKDWKSFKTQVLGNDVSYEDIVSYDAELLENPRTNLYFKEMKELIGSYIGHENLPSDEVLAKITGKIKCSTVRSKFLCFYIGISLFEQECIPNTNVVGCGSSMKIWAIKKIAKGKDKITITARSILKMSTKERILREENIMCKCTDCRLPYGESILSKIIDDKRAYSVISQTESLLQAASIFPEICLSPWFRSEVSIMLQKQEGVLGNTNCLRLRLLALKCFGTGEHPLLLHKFLMELEESARSVFGEYYSEMQSLYHNLSVIHFDLGNPAEGVNYLQKANRIIQHTIY